MFWMAVMVMFQVAGEILGSDIVGQIGTAICWFRCGFVGKVGGAYTRRVGVGGEL